MAKRALYFVSESFRIRNAHPRGAVTLNAVRGPEAATGTSDREEPMQAVGPITVRASATRSNNKVFILFRDSVACLINLLIVRYSKRDEKRRDDNWFHSL